MFHIYIFITIYIFFISADAVFDVDSDSDLRLDNRVRCGHTQKAHTHSFDYAGSSI